jgi:hypothetical protein
MGLLIRILILLARVFMERKSSLRHLMLISAENLHFSQQRLKSIRLRGINKTMSENGVNFICDNRAEKSILNLICMRKKFRLNNFVSHLF